MKVLKILFFSLIFIFKFEAQATTDQRSQMDQRDHANPVDQMGINDPLLKIIKKNFIGGQTPTLETLSLDHAWSCRRVPVADQNITESQNAFIFIYENDILHDFGDWTLDNAEFSFSAYGLEYQNKKEKYVLRQNQKGDLLYETYLKNDTNKDGQKGIAYPQNNVTAYTLCESSKKRPADLYSLKSLQERFMSARLPEPKNLNQGKAWACKSYNTIGNSYRLGLLDKVVLQTVYTNAFTFEIPTCWGQADCLKPISITGEMETYAKNGNPIFKYFYQDSSQKSMGLYSGSDIYRLFLRVEPDGTLIGEESFNNTWSRDYFGIEFLAPISLIRQFEQFNFNTKYIAVKYIVCR